MKPRVLILLIAAVVGLALAGPSPAAGGDAVATADPALDHCCSHPDEGSDPRHPAGEEPGDCCPDGCDACPSCTGGASALLGTPVEGPSGSPAGASRALFDLRGPASADPGGIDHPPRA